MVSKEEQLKEFFNSVDELESILKNREIFIFLDYDGTLTPIVDTPDQAVLSDDMRTAVKKLSQRYKVSIVSGRATDDVHDKVALDNLYYAGSHGFEILQPDGKIIVNKEAGQIRDTIEAVYRNISEQLQSIKGCLVENVKYTISVHYRLVSQEDHSQVEEAVKKTLKENKNLRKTDGKKVFEIRPDLDWHKGKAVEFILKAFEFDSEKQTVVYIGDDTTDEDAFEAVKDIGAGVLVAEEHKETQAQFVVKDTRSVRKVLQYFIDR